MTTLGGSFDLGGTTTVGRMGFGTMRLPAWPTGRKIDRDTAHAILRRALELGVNHVDTAGFYSRDGMTSNALIREALHPYPEHLVLATKIGPRFDESGHGPAAPASTVPELRKDLEQNLTELGIDKIDLVNLRLGGIDGNFDGDARQAFESLAALREEGLIDHLGVSNVTGAVLDAALEIAPVATVQNEFNVLEQSDGAMVDRCAAEGIGYVPYFPLGGHVNPDALADKTLVEVAEANDETPARIALAWLLRRSPTVLLIPGTSSVRHLEQNAGATEVELSDKDFARLSEVGVNGS
jgi:aryl-alcohol dehydrogenase-like predicted oxidoreductase